jgi:hypothetical protein
MSYQLFGIKCGMMARELGLELGCTKHRGQHKIHVINHSITPAGNGLVAISLKALNKPFRAADFGISIDS